ncbi:MAG: DMT family transporter [Rhizobiaceae bacterium]
MPGSIVLIVLCGALLHASWNAVVKSAGDKFLNAVVIMTISMVMSAMLLPFLIQPNQESWPYLTLSSALQAIYVALIARAYRGGDMSVAYPLMRGTAPLLVSLVSLPLIGEALPPLRWLGVALVSAGVLVMAFDSLRVAKAGGSTLATALVNACFIAAYTVTDGIGVRISGAPIAYTLWIFVLHALPLLFWALLTARAKLIAQFRARWRAGLFGGAATVSSYGSALWAMSQNVPVAAVAALRETSILFAAAISFFLFKEALGRFRMAGIIVILAGVALIRIA